MASETEADFASKRGDESINYFAKTEEPVTLNTMVRKFETMLLKISELVLSYFSPFLISLAI